MYNRFNGLLLQIGLHHSYNMMSQLSMFSEGMNVAETKCGILRSPVPIPFISHGNGKTDTYDVHTV